jgi:hypothetical protein
MLSLLETLRNLVVSGHKPASYLVTLHTDGTLLLCSDPDGSAGGFRVGARPVSGGYWLEVSHTGDGYQLEQFCRALPGGRFEALPHTWAPRSTRFSDRS